MAMFAGGNMAINGINNYRDTLYQWQAQQLKSTGNSSSSTASSTAINTLFGGSASMTSQISSMVELTKYAMDQMGVSSDARVTFSQITKYREQLQSEFNSDLQKAIAESGISNVAALSYTLDSSGKITAVGANDSDRKKAQAWLDANPSFGKAVLSSIPADAFTGRGEIAFTLSSTGSMTVVNAAQDNLQSYLNENGNLADNMRKQLEADGIAVSWPLDLKFNDSGELQASGNTEGADAVNAWLKENPAIASDLKKQMEKQKVDGSAVSLRLGKQGPLQISVNNAELNDIQAGFDKAKDTGTKLIQGLNDLGIDKNINFSIQVDENGQIKIISDHPDAAKVQKLFDDNPELVKKYRQIETLAGIDDARKAMQISPSAMRKRIQIESMAAWWSDSGSASSYFGNYSNSNLSLLSGLNLSV